jgi:hypothetical protein
MENKISKLEITQNLILYIIIHFGSLLFTIPIGLFILIIRFNQYIYLQMPKIWKEIKEL